MPLKYFSIGLAKPKSTKKLSWKLISAMAYSKFSQYEDISIEWEKIVMEASYILK